MVHEMLQRFYGFTNASTAEFKESCNKGEHALVVSASAQTICYLIEEGPEALKSNDACCSEVAGDKFALLVSYLCSCYDLTCKWTALLLQNRLLK